MKRSLTKIVFALLLFSINSFVFAQDNIKEGLYIKDKVTLNIGTTIYQDYGFDDMMISLNGLYGINNWLETGLFSTIFSDKATFEILGESVNTRSTALYYGAEARAHLLPLIITPSYYRFVVYANLQLGAKSFLYDKKLRDNNIMKNHTKFFINGAIGVGFNFNRNIGLFYECGYSNTDKLNHNIGLMLKL